MNTKNKGGRIEKEKDYILQRRKEIIIDLLNKNWSKADVARLFNIDRSQITRAKTD